MIAQTVAQLLEERVTLDLEGVDRLYLNAYQPMLETGGGVATFFKYQRGAKVASSVLMALMTQAFVNARRQVFDRPLSGRYFFEEVIRENLDLGRPSQVSLIFGRRVTKRTPGSFRTRVVTEGVTPSLHVSYKWSKIKQYFKEDKALRTETTINNPRDFGIGKKLKNLPALRETGFQNRRLLDVQKIS